MKIRTSRLCVQTSVWVLASAFCVTILTGCGANGNFLTQGVGPDTAVEGLSGTVHGGPNPVSGATITLYSTWTVPSPSAANSYGYGQSGVANATSTVLGTTTTNSTGGFTLTGDAKNCPAGQQAYIVSAGGNTGANSANPAALMMAALGPCASLSDTTQVTIDEPTTIAAAYALSGFMTVNGTEVDISAPANNNALTAGCTIVSNAVTACAASGLAHAFLNAANLVNSATGFANAAPPTNSTATVPVALIYTLANSVEACINSSGDITTPTAPCAILMTNTTPTQLSSPNPPTNTLQALQYLAQYPSEATGCSSPPCAPGTGTGTPVEKNFDGATPSATTTALYNVANSNAYYSPALDVTPLDFTIAIVYPETGAMWGSAADINDNIYVYDNESPVTIFSLSSDGAANWSTPISTGAGCGSTSYRCSVTTDFLGNLWVADSSGLTELTTAGVKGTTFTTVDKLESATVDLGDNVWLAAQGLGTANGTQTAPSALEELPRGATQIIDVNVGGNPEPYAIKQPVFDSAGNMWCESDNTGGSGGPGAILMLSDTGSLTSPAFTNAGSGNGNPVNYKAPSGTNLDASPGNAPLIDPSGNLWVSAQDNMYSIPSGGTEASGGLNYGKITIEYGPVYEAGVDRNGAMDGDGNIIMDATSTGQGYLSIYYPNAPDDGQFTVVAGATGDTGADTYINPCYIAPSTYFCQLEPAGGQSTIVNNPRSSTVDSTGAIWAPTQSSGFVVQVIGPGAPTWPIKAFFPLALAPNLAGNATSLRPF